MTDVRNLNLLNRLVGYNLRRASAAFLADYAAHLGPGALRPTQLAILACLQAEERTTASVLGRLLSIKKANLTPLIAELERAGLIATAEIQADRRSKSLCLTALGREKLAEAERKILEHERRLLASFSPSEKAALLALLGRLWAPAAN